MVRRMHHHQRPGRSPSEAAGSPSLCEPEPARLHVLNPRGIQMSPKSMIGILSIVLALGAFGATNAVALNPQPGPLKVKYTKYQKSPPTKRLPPNPCAGSRCLKQQQVKRKLPPNPCKGSACVAR